MVGGAHEGSADLRRGVIDVEDVGAVVLGLVLVPDAEAPRDEAIHGEHARGRVIGIVAAIDVQHLELDVVGIGGVKHHPDHHRGIDVGRPRAFGVLLEDHAGGLFGVIDAIAAAIVHVEPSEFGGRGLVGEGAGFAIAVDIDDLDAVDARSAVELIHIELVVDEGFVEVDLVGIDLDGIAVIDADDDAGFGAILGHGDVDGGIGGAHDVGDDVARTVADEEVIVATGEGVAGDRVAIKDGHQAAVGIGIDGDEGFVVGFGDEFVEADVLAGEGDDVAV